MKKVFVFQDFKSQKFWSIEPNGTDLMINYGKLGTDGQTQVKSFASVEEANKAADKLIAEKTKKGYVETAEESAKEMKVEAKKYGLSYDDYDNGKTDVDLLNKILKDKNLPNIKQLTIGCWSFESGSCEDLLKGIVENADKFAHVEGLYWGDIDAEESEISWIEQTDLSQLFDIMPKLKELKIQGTNSLVLGHKKHDALQSLEIISGGLPASVVDDIAQSDYPNLEKLVLYVGIDNYGFDGDLNTFKPVASKARFPKLKYLGILNAEFQDDIVAMLLQSDILPQLETLDLSYGGLTDKGGQMLLDNAGQLKHLKLINITYHYMSDEMCKKLAGLPCKVNTANSQYNADEDADEGYRYPMITE